MDVEKTFTSAEAHKHFAIAAHGETWTLLENPARSAPDAEMMLYAAYASCYHWRHTGTAVHHQRGEWLIARVNTVLRYPEAALRHAVRCLQLTTQYASEMADFDFAFAYEALARAHALYGTYTEAQKYLEMAERAGQKIAEAEERDIFFAEMNGGNWYGLR